MKKRLFLIIAIFFLVSVFGLPSAVALGEPWEVAGSIPGDPYYNFSQPRSVATDAAGNLYVADYNYDRIKRYTPDGLLDTSWGGDGIIGGVGGSGDDQFHYPSGLVVDAAGNLYVADSSNSRIKRYTSAGILDTSWGGGDGIIGGTQGSGADEFYGPCGVAVDTAGNLFVADSANDRIKKYTALGNLDTTWGGGDGMIGSIGSGDDEFNLPRSIAVDLATGNIYVSDSGNDRIARYAADGTRDTTWGSNGYIGSHGTGTTQFETPEGVSVDTAGNLYVTDKYNHRVKRYNASGALDTTWSADGIVGGSQGNGAEQFDLPSDVAVDLIGNVYIADTNNNRIKRYTAGALLDTSWGREGILCKNGSGTDQLKYPRGAVTDAAGNLYIADTSNDRVKCYTAQGILNTGWGGGDGMIGTEGSGPDEFNGPHGLAVDSSGNLYISDLYNHRVKRYTPDGNLDISWGNGGIIGTTQGSGANQFNYPQGLAVDSAGNLYVADSSNDRIKRYTSNGNLDTSWSGDGMLGTLGSGPDELDGPYDVAVDAQDRLYVVERNNNRVKRFTPEGIRDISWSDDGIIGGTPGSGAEDLSGPLAVSVDTAGNLYVADYHNHRIKRYKPDGTLDTNWFTGGIWQAIGTRENMELPWTYPNSITTFETRVYSVWENRVMIFCDVETQLKLSDLSVYGSTVSGFNPETLEYTVVVAKTATHVQIGADTMSIYGSVSGTGTLALPSSNSTQFMLTVTAETGDTQIYTLNVLRDGEDVGLTEIKIDGAVISGYSEAKTNYEVTVPYGARYVKIDATGNSYCNQIVGTGFFELTGDSTDFAVTAKAQDGSAKEYNLTVKKGSFDADWITATIDGKSIGTSGISIVVPEGGKTVTLRITRVDGTYVSLPISLLMQSAATPTTQPTNSPSATETAAPSEEPISDTDDTSSDVTVAAVDGVAISGNVTMEVPEGGKTMVLTIEMPDGTMVDIPVELIPEASFANVAADIPADTTQSPVFAWWWILVGVLGAGLIGTWSWVMLVQKKR